MLNKKKNVYLRHHHCFLYALSMFSYCSTYTNLLMASYCCDNFVFLTYTYILYTSVYMLFYKICYIFYMDIHTFILRFRSSQRFFVAT